MKEAGQNQTGLEVQPAVTFDRRHPLLTDKNTILLSFGELGSALQKALEKTKYKPAYKDLSDSNLKDIEITKLLKNKRMAFCIFDHMPPKAFFDLCALASTLEVALLPVIATEDKKITMGPMIPTGFANNLNLKYFEKESNTSSSVKLSRFNLPGKTTLETAAGLIDELGTAVTMPLLWYRADISGEDTELTPLGNHGLANQKSRSELFSIIHYLNPAIFDNSKTTLSIEKSLTDGNLVSINDAFIPQFAEAAFQALNQTENWNVHEEFFDFFYYHHHNLYDLAQYPDEVLTCKLIFNSQPTYQWIQKLTGADCSAPTALSGSLYMPGDHSLPHTDATQTRSVAFIWHLTKEWKSAWGGGLFWCGNMNTIYPEFNVLHLFKISATSYHFVTQVTPKALGKRLTLNGWWHSQEEDVELKNRTGINIKKLDPEGKVFCHSKFTGDLPVKK